MRSAVKRLADGIAMAANAAGTLVVVLLVAVVNYDIIARGLFNRPFLGAVEVVQFSMVLIVFLQLPDVIRVGRLTRSDGFLGLLAVRAPRKGRLLSRAIDLISAIFMALVVYAMWPEFLEMWASQDYFGVPGVFTAPWWPVKLVILLSAGLCVVHFLLHVARPLIDDQPELESGS
ncbi:Tripartite ATP-independent periplasmic transporters, DctQ component [Marinovum algicola]|uniref:TRAP transporter small permease protein n=1 Tax=Marinovum algicola TaxID=42444 RepID=A0A975ZM57_9RHOB|nr:TRAP-type mannitol/chloroaromatic compound transport system, small permease component [Marinovum algicola]SLN13226.1 Tripartite ATP-independent periplasmic transporters, DctQ component [Marinovum algicola]